VILEPTKRGFVLTAKHIEIASWIVWYAPLCASMGCLGFVLGRL